VKRGYLKRKSPLIAKTGLKRGRIATKPPVTVDYASDAVIQPQIAIISSTGVTFRYVGRLITW
jgi:hypothetical protein